MENTIIIKNDGTGINSKDCCSFHLNVIMVRKLVKIGSEDKPQSKTYPSRIDLVAHTFEGKKEFISRLRGGIDDACSVLQSLLKAVGTEKVWDVREHNSGQGLDKGQVDIQGTRIAASSGKIEPTDQEPPDIKGTVIDPSTC